jgi:hypothetical protein
MEMKGKKNQDVDLKRDSIKTTQATHTSTKKCATIREQPKAMSDDNHQDQNVANNVVVDPNAPATMGHILALRAELRADMKADMVQLRADVKADMVQLRADMVQLITNNRMKKEKAARKNVDTCVCF